MAKRKAAKKAAKRTKAKKPPTVVKLAERIGSFLGRVRKKADSLMPGPPREARRAPAPPKRASAKAGKKAKKAKKAKR
jgi:hypothetical protein